MCNFLDRLARLSSAEDIIAAVGLSCEQSVLDIHRLHILKRFRDHLCLDQLTDADERTVRAACQAAMGTALREFTGAHPPRAGFQLFRRTAPQAFIPISAIRPGEPPRRG